MRLFVASAVLITLAGCVSQRAELRNDLGQVVQCANDGWGWLGAPIAAARQADCLNKAQAAGYIQTGDLQPARASTDAVALLNSKDKAPNLSVAKTPEAVTAIQAVPAPSASIDPTPSQSQVSRAAVNGSPAERLKNRQQVYESGLISKEEYDRKCQEIPAAL